MAKSNCDRCKGQPGSAQPSRLHRPGDCSGSCAAASTVAALVFAGTYRMPLLRPMMSLVRAFEVPDLSAASRDAQTRTVEMIDSVVARLQAGDCFLIYPSGRLQRGSQEVIGAARAVHEIVQRTPNINIVLVRTRGVWAVALVVLRMVLCLTWPTNPRGTRLGAGQPDLLPAASTRSFAHRSPFNAVSYRSNHAINSILISNSGTTSTARNSRCSCAIIIFSVPSLATTALKPQERKSTCEDQAEDDRTSQSFAEYAAEARAVPEELEPNTTLESLGLDSLERMDFALQVEKQFGFRSNEILTTVGALWALADGQLSVAQPNAGGSCCVVGAASIG